jgi:hypothetical protein
MIDVEKPGVKSAQEPVNENRKKELANTENIYRLIAVASARCWLAGTRWWLEQLGCPDLLEP